MTGRSDDYDVEVLYKWIDSYPITRQKRNISRDFSDAVPLAEMLKQHFPKLVELHNYSPRNSVAHKLVNWNTLNRKVLVKLDMGLSNNLMEQVAQSMPGAIERILCDIKSKLEARELEKTAEDTFMVEGLSANISGSIVPVKQSNSSKITHHKVVPLDIFTKMEEDLIEKDQTILTLKQRIEHLESLQSVKDERIKDLTKQIQKLNSDASTIRTTLGGSKFFNKIF